MPTVIDTMFGLVDYAGLTTNFQTMLSGFLAASVIGTVFVYIIAASRKGRAAAR